MKKKGILMVALVGVSAMMLFTACKKDKAEDTTQTTEDTKQNETTEVKDAVQKIDDPTTFTRISVHDPTIVKAEDGTFYLFGSHLAAGKSKDLASWANIGSAKKLFGVNKIDEIMPNIKEWMNIEGGDLGCWAADVIYNTTTKKYYFYACSSQFGSTDSVMWFATSDNIDGPYSGATPIIYSGFMDTTSGEWAYTNTNVGDLLANGTIEKGDWFHSDGSYDSGSGKMPNAIDPALFYDKDGRMWMSYGSYFGGIYILEIDVNTGMPIYPKKDDPENNVVSYFGKLIANPAGVNGSGEGPYIIYDKASDYYFLFVTYGNLDGLGGYNTRVYRSKNPYGPYEDAKGQLATSNVEKGLKVMGNYHMTGTLGYISPGHSSALVDDETGKILYAYHTRFNDGAGNAHQVRIHQMFVNQYGFPIALPYEYDGETIGEEKITVDDVVGTYGFVNHGNNTTYSNDINNVTIRKETDITFNADGTISGKMKGTWSFDEEGSPYVTIKLMNVEYKGVFCYQTEDVSKSNKRLVFAAGGDNNMVIWGVRK